ncbi:MAG: hypothetical protein ACRDF0_05120, partial [Candidatus Limnocylindria bacterium]
PRPASATPAPALADDMTAAFAAKPLPPADLFDLVRRLKGRDGTPAAPFVPVRTSPPDEAVGTARRFWTYDFAAKRNVQISATLHVMTDHAKWWIADGVRVDERALRATADVFEGRIYPTNRRIYGPEWSPGIDGDPRITILLAPIPGRAAGYFSSADAYPTWVNAFSAEREMIYLNSLAAPLGSESLYAVLAHELCHMQQFNKRVRSIVWFNEGQAQLCERVNGFSSGFEQAFLRQPDTQLNDWPELDESAILHYGGAFLFLEFLRQRAGGEELINAFMAEGIDTPGDLDRVLRARGRPGVEELYADFVAANAFIGSSPEPRHAYSGGVRPTIAASVAERDRVALSGTHRASVHQYAARYVELPRAAYQLSFSGAQVTPVIPTEPRSGRAFWWSDRADGLDSRLTRTVDLSGTATAALTFWTWYDIEDDFDYAYVAVSTDGGARWATLATQATTRTDPNGNNLGDGFTGRSGGAERPVWTQQRVDLTPYAGQRILLRFEYVTDGALTESGFAVDDLEIAEIGYRDDAEADNGWQAEGFVRSTNVVKQRYVVQLLRFGDRPTVERHAVEDGRLTLSVDAGGDRRPPLLAVTAFAPRTTESAAFEITLSPAP